MFDDWDHEVEDKICLHCKVALSDRDIPKCCELSYYARRARWVFENIGLEFAGVEKDRSTWYATFRSRVAPGHCERMYAEQIEAILKLLERCA